MFVPIVIAEGMDESEMARRQFSGGNRCWLLPDPLTTEDVEYLSDLNIDKIYFRVQGANSSTKLAPLYDRKDKSNRSK